MEHSKNIYALFAHIQNGSITAEKGQAIKKRQILGRVGHSGNSTAPHLHFQLMDSMDIVHAKGILAGFNEYKVYRNREWVVIKKGNNTRVENRNILCPPAAVRF